MDHRIKRRKIGKWLLLSVAAILVLSGLVWLLWYEGFLIPSWTRWKTYDETVDVNGEEVRIRLSKRKLSLILDDQTLWKSDNRWRVADALFGDLDRDGGDEVVLLVWKQGSYGQYRPFWVEKNDKSWSQHIFIYQWDKESDQRMVPIWMSSRIGMKASSIYLDEDAVLHITEPDGKESLWRWDSWGLTLIS